MAEFCIHREDWPHLEALQEAGGSMRMRDVEPRAFTNLKVCGMVACRDADGAITIALTPAGYALLAERERWRSAADSIRERIDPVSDPECAWVVDALEVLP